MSIDDIINRLENIQKYDPCTGSSGPFAAEIDWEEVPDGEWIKVDDLKVIISELQASKTLIK